MRNHLVLVAVLAVSQVAFAQVRTSAESFPIKPAAAALPVVPFAPQGSSAPSESSGVVSRPSEAAAGRVWEIRLQDVNLASTFARWASESGWRVRWDARKHVLVEAPDRITGSFEDAIAAVLEGPGIANSAYPLEVCFYTNSPPLARITRRGEQDKECN